MNTKKATEQEKDIAHRLTYVDTYYLDSMMEIPDVAEMF
jgi:hypothetical protein